MSPAIDVGDMDEPDAPGAMVKSDLTLFTVLEGLHELDRAGVTELADRVGLNKGTVHKHLQSLEHGGWVVKEDGTYRPSLEFFVYGAKRVENIELCTLGKQKVVELATEAGMPAGFMVREGTRAVQTASFDERPTYRVLPDTFAYPLHGTASGKAILSKLPEAEVREVAAETGLPALTDHTVTDVEELLAELAEVEERGYALNREETSQRWNGVATPVEHPDGSELGALYLGWPRRQISDSQIADVLDPLLAAADEMYLQLQY